MEDLIESKKTSSINIQNIDRPTLVKAITDQLMELIINKELLPDHELPSECELAGLFSTGKSSIREALKSLETLGVIEIRHGKKAIVKYPSFEPMEKIFRCVVFCTKSGLEDILEFRSILETEAASFAAKRRTERQLVNIKTALDEFINSPNEPVEKFTKNDMNFHISIAEAAGNILLTYTIQAFREVLKGSIKKLFIPSEERDYKGLFSRHINIYKCIEAKDPIGAKKAVGIHFEASHLIPKE